MSEAAIRKVSRRRRLGLGAMALASCLTLAIGAGLVPLSAEPPRTLTVPFDVGTEAGQGAEAALDAAAAALLGAPALVAVVTGHTGPAGDPEANRALSLSRADAVAEALVARGVPRDRIVTLGAGGAMPPDREAGESAAAYEARLRRAHVALAPRSLLAEAGG